MIIPFFKVVTSQCLFIGGSTGSWEQFNFSNDLKTPVFQGFLSHKPHIFWTILDPTENFGRKHPGMNCFYPKKIALHSATLVL